MFLRRSLLWVSVAGCVPEVVGDRPSIVPEGAEEVEPNVYFIGTDIDPVTGEEVEGWVFVEDLDDEPDVMSLAKRPAPGPAPCWSTLGAAGWAAPESWSFDPTNSSGIADVDAQTAFETAHATWEAAAGVDIFGSYTDTNTQIAVTGLDGENNLRFGDTGGPGILAFANVWWPAGGKPDTRHVYEWDVVMMDLGQKLFTVSAEAGSFDLENVSAHEFGHALGLGHPPDTCTEETMYRFISIAETTKRDLHTGDIEGVADLY